MKQSRSLKHILRVGTWSTVLAFGLAAQAAEFYQTRSMNPGEHWNEAYWTNATHTVTNTPSSGNTYINDVGGTRTPSDGANFLGDLLTIKSGRQLQFKHGSSSSVTVNLVMEDGSTMANGSSTGKMEGTLNGSGAITLDTTQYAGRPIFIGSLLESDNTFSEFEIVGNEANVVTFTNSANTFTGVWDVASGTLNGAGFGQASGFIVGGSGRLDFDADFVNMNADITISSGGEFLLDQNVEVYSAQIWGITLTNNTYTGAELKANPVYGAAFTGSSDASTLTISYTPPVIVGDTIYQTADMPSGTDWNDPSYWDNGLAPIFSNDYVNAGAGWGTRTPGSGSGSFGGNSLTLTNSAKLTIKSNGPWTIDNFNIWVGSSISSGGPSAPTIAGGLNLKGSGSVVLDAQFPGRMTTISSLIDADTTVTNIIIQIGQTAPTNTAQALTAGYIMSGLLNDFNGVWVVQEGLLKGENFGAGSFLITDMGYLDFDADYNNSSASLTIEANPTNSTQSGMILLDQIVTVGSATIWGETLADGLYFGGDLKAHPIYGGAFDPASSDGALLAVGAEIITQTEGHSGNESWETTNKWSNGEAASTNFHYINNLGAGTRTPNYSNPTFPGKSLTLDNGSSLLQRHTGTGTISNMTMTAGCAISLATGGIKVLDGDIELKGSGSFTLDFGFEGRTCDIQSLLTVGESIHTIELNRNGNWNTNAFKTSGYTLSNPLNTFDGLWHVQDGYLKGVGFGTSSFLVDDWAYLDFDSDYSNTNASLTVTNGGMVLLDQTITVGAANINGDELDANTYSAATLISTYPDAFDATSSGTLIVDKGPVPEIGDITIGVADGSMVFGWDGSALASYTVQADNDLVFPPGWSNVVGQTDIPGIDGPMGVTNAVTDPKMFYRVIGN
ncbi:hypothetical protein P4E94_07085 [Pontiellaceae bacterium B12219]|nr:hypothetical protein [Pontiellaceae bacterium B12219]